MPDNKPDGAVQMFGQGFNCCQAILASYALEHGLDRQAALRLAAGFGGGMGRMGETCGAVTGAFMVLGLRHGGTDPSNVAAKERTHTLVREFAARFKRRHGSIVCKQLLGHDLSVPAEFERAKQEGCFTTLCPKFVRDAAEILDELSAEMPGKE